MPTKKSFELGPTGETTAHNIRRVRTLRHMTLDDVAALMRFAGRPMSKATLSQIEIGKRRVDVDDLLVLCQVLKCNPSTLLLPPALPNGECGLRLTGFGWQRSSAVRDWAEGRFPLDPPIPPQTLHASDWETWAAVDLHSLSLSGEDQDVPNRKVDPQ